MGQDTPGWDDIPSLDELKIDWDFEPENPLGKRNHDRLTEEQLYALFQTKKIPVRIVSMEDQSKAFLVNISQGGVSLRTKDGNLSESQLIKIGFFLGKKKVISKGRIRNIRKEHDWIILGIEFVGLDEGNNEYIADIYSSNKLRS